MQSRWNRWKQILAIAWPLIIANSFWNIQMTVDRVFLGTYSTEALGAAMAVMGVFWVPMALLQQTAAYSATFVAQYFGAKENDRIGPAVWQAIHISVIGGLLFLLLNFASEWFFSLVGHSPTVQVLEVEYFNAVAFAALPMALTAAFSGFFTGLAWTRVVIGINAAGVTANVFFDYVLIFGNWGFPELGMAGAGYATALASTASVLYGGFLLFNRKYETEFRIISGWKFDRDLLYRYFKFGFPSGMQFALEGMAFTVFLVITGNFVNGDAALAASSIAVTVLLLAILPTMGMAQAVMVLTGQHLGNKRPELAEEATYSGVQVSFIYMVMLGMTFLLFPEFYISWFANDANPELWSSVAEITKYLLVFVAMFTLFDGFNFNFSFALKGAGDTRFVSLVALTIPWPIMVLPTFLFKDHPMAVYISWGFAVIYVAVIAGIFWRRFKGGAWKKMSVID